MWRRDPHPSQALTGGRSARHWQNTLWSPWGAVSWVPGVHDRLGGGRPVPKRAPHLAPQVDPPINCFRVRCRVPHWILFMSQELTFQVREFYSKVFWCIRRPEGLPESRERELRGAVCGGASPGPSPGGRKLTGLCPPHRRLLHTGRAKGCERPVLE